MGGAWRSLIGGLQGQVSLSPRAGPTLGPDLFAVTEPCNQSYNSPHLGDGHIGAKVSTELVLS